jgi:hypothetical protein
MRIHVGPYTEVSNIEVDTSVLPSLFSYFSKNERERKTKDKCEFEKKRNGARE